MRYLILSICYLLLAACSTTSNQQFVEDETYYVPQTVEDDYSVYKPMSSGQVFHVAGFDVDEGQQMRDFFDDFEEPMHTYYNGNTVEWTYYVDYNAREDEGKIVRYCELDQYRPHSLCAIKISFYKTYVSDATTNCR